MITEDERFIEIQSILAMSDVHPADCIKINNLIIQLSKENKQLQNNWNELKKWVNRYYDYYMNNEDFIGGRLCFTDIKNKMEELEGKSE